MTIRSRVATDQYRREWERVFGKRYTCHTPHECAKGGCLYPSKCGPLNPHDADEHPKAD